MASRPRLTDQTFLAHLFHPKKNAVPTGLRKTQLSGLTGRSKARVRSYNRMSAVNQELLKRSGQREDYLRGDTTIAKAKSALREEAIRLGVAKPVRPRTPHVPTTYSPSLRRMIQQHLRTIIIDAGRPFDDRSMDMASEHYEDANVGPEVLKWKYPQLKYAGRRGSEYEIIVDGQVRNPLWYH